MPPAARIIGILLGRQRVVLDVRAPATADEAVESVARGNGVTGADQHGREVRATQAAGLLAYLFERDVDAAVAKARDDALGPFQTRVGEGAGQETHGGVGEVEAVRQHVNGARPRVGAGDLDARKEIDTQQCCRGRALG
jgi:hypothetical protein